MEDTKIQFALKEVIVIDPHELDTQYKSFPSFTEWKNLQIDIDAWNKYSSKVKEAKKNVSKDVLDKAEKIMLSATAIDTGAIENLYKLNDEKGFTITVATDFALHDTTNYSKLLEVINGTEEEKEKALPFIKDQISTYQTIMEQAVQNDRPINPTFVRQIHNSVCASQKHYLAINPQGNPFQKKLLKGDYKISPNHVFKRDGSGYHTYCPVDFVAQEMEKLFKEINSTDFQNSHPALKASYVHYAFILIHPFADGNGRVARVFASLYIYQSEFIPLMILHEKRDDYIKLLTEADEKNFQSFVTFVFDTCIDTMDFLKECIISASTLQVEDVISNIENFKVTSGGIYKTILKKQEKSF